MSSPAQFDANRANSGHSTGPRTEQGKTAIAYNAVTHGLSARHVVLPGENPEIFDALHGALREEHNPLGATESFLVAKLAESQWKSLRISEMETELLTAPPDVYEGRPDLTAAQIAAHIFQIDASNKGVIEKLARYAVHERRAHDQFLRQLLFLQRIRRTAERKEAADQERARKEQAAATRQNRRQAGKAAEQYMETLFGGSETNLPPEVEAELKAAGYKTKPISIASNGSGTASEDAPPLK